MFLEQLLVPLALQEHFLKASETHASVVLKDHSVLSQAQYLLKRVANVPLAPSARLRLHPVRMSASNAHLARVPFRGRPRRSQTAYRFVPPALGLRPASPRAPHAQRELPTQTRAPPASPSASLALQVIFLFSLDKARALFAPQELGAAVLAPSTLLPASHVPPGRTMLYQDPQV